MCPDRTSATAYVAKTYRSYFDSSVPGLREFIGKFLCNGGDGGRIFAGRIFSVFSLQFLFDSVLIIFRVVAFPKLRDFF